MKVLYISSKPAYPVVDGGSHATAAFLDTLLESNFEVDYLFISTPKHRFQKDKFPTHIVEKVNLGQTEIDTSVKILPAIQHLFNKKSYNVSRFYSKEMSQLISKRINEKQFDVVVLDSLFTTCYLEDIKSISSAKILVRTHNVEGDLWLCYANNSSGLKSIYLNKLAKDISHFEKEILSKADGILTITKDDADRFSQLGITTEKHVCPVAIPSRDYSAKYQHNKVYHLGSMDWEPNRESVDKLIEVWPTIRSRNSQAQLAIAGKHADQFYSSDSENGINVIGFVDDPTEFAVSQGILVAPIHSGSGVRIKILEAMSIGIPVISTEIGAMGIDYKSTNCLRVIQTDNELIDATLELINSEEKRTEIGQNALDYIRKNHNIAEISRSLIEFIQSN